MFDDRWIAFFFFYDGREPHKETRSDGSSALHAALVRGILRPNGVVIRPRKVEFKTSF